MPKNTIVRVQRGHGDGRGHHRLHAGQDRDEKTLLEQDRLGHSLSIEQASSAMLVAWRKRTKTSCIIG